MKHPPPKKKTKKHISLICDNCGYRLQKQSLPCCQILQLMQEEGEGSWGGAEWTHYSRRWGGCGSGVEPAPCYWKVQWFDSPGLHVKVSLGKILNPKLLLMSWSAPCIAATSISVWMFIWITVSCFGHKHLLKVLKCKYIHYCFGFISVDGEHLEHQLKMCSGYWLTWIEPHARQLTYHFHRASSSSSSSSSSSVFSSNTVSLLFFLSSSVCYILLVVDDGLPQDRPCLYALPPSFSSIVPALNLRLSLSLSLILDLSGCLFQLQ